MTDYMDAYRRKAKEHKKKAVMHARHQVAMEAIHARTLLRIGEDEAKTRGAEKTRGKHVP